MKKVLLMMSLLLTSWSAFAINQLPIPVLGANPISGNAPLTVQFSSNGTHDPDGYINYIGWNFGDGAHTNQPHPSHVYTMPGTYRVALTVFDNLGGRGQRFKTITVGNGGGAPASKVGIIGCSMTMGAVDGTVHLGSDEFWHDPIPVIGGGGVAQWLPSANNPWWAAFQSAYNAEPTNVIWWELCSVASTSSQQTLANAVLVLNEIKARVPDAMIYVSTQPNYDSVDPNDPNHYCFIAGENGWNQMNTIRSQLLAGNYGVLPGPELDNLIFPTQTLQDGCHGTPAGNDAMGQQLLDFNFLQ